VRRLAYILALLLLSGCTRTVYQDREVVRHDSIYVTALAVDTILQRDSIHTIERGDTVTTTIYKYIYKVRERRDTLVIYKTDTLTQTQTVEVVKTKKTTDWGKCAIALLVGIGITFLMFVVVKKRN